MSENSEKKEITINKEKWKSHLKDFFYPFVIVFLILIIIVHFSYAMDCCNDVVYISIPAFLNLGEFESYEGFKTIFVRGDYDNHKYYLGDPSVWGTSEIYYNYFTRLINYYIPYVLIEKWKLLFFSTIIFMLLRKAFRYFKKNYAIKIN